MHINTRVLDARGREYINGPGSNQVWGELVNSVLFNVIGSFFMIFVALILICTLILAWTGLQLLYGIVMSFLTLKVFQNPRKEYDGQPDRVRPVILASIISGPNGHALMLGSLEERTQGDAEFLARKASEFGEIYLDESGNGKGKFFELLRDDTFQAYRRRTVPVSHSEGRELILFDVEYEMDEIHFSEGREGWLAAVVTIDEKEKTDDEIETDDPPPGRIVQIPWEVVEDAFVES